MSKRIIFVDSHINNYQSLIKQLPQNSEVILLDATQDGIEQILDALRGKNDLSVIDIISHGSPGTLALGSAVLNISNIDEYAEKLGRIGECLGENGDILLYGCEIAKGEIGQIFIEKLSNYTGADVAASTKLIGAAELGGNWSLDKCSDRIATDPIYFTYDSVLAIINGTSNNDKLYGTSEDDTFVGGQGDDIITGGIGNDLAVFSGEMIDYEISTNAAGQILVKDINLINGDDGLDTLSSVQVLRFHDGDFKIAPSGVSGDFRINNTQGVHFPSIAGLSDGGFAAVYRVINIDGTQEIFAQRFAADSSIVTAEFLVTTDAGLALGGEPKIAALNDGGFVVSYSVYEFDGTNASERVFVQRFAADSSKVGEKILVSGSYSTDCVITGLSDNGFVVAWRIFGVDSLDIYAQRFDSIGNKMGEAFRVNTGGYCGDPFITALTDGGFVVSWVAAPNSPLLAQCYDANGERVGEEIIIKPFSSEIQYYSLNISGLNNGGFLASWSIDGGGTYAQLYDASGTKVKAEFEVAPTTGYYISITALNDGGFVVSWSDYSGSNFRVHAQRYDVNGERMGGEFLVSTGSQNALLSDIRSLDDGGFVVSWMYINSITGESEGVYARRYDADGIPVHTSFELIPLNAAPTGSPTAVLANGIEDNNYSISEVDLLTGFSAGGDPLHVTNLVADHGSVTDNLNGTYTITPESNYNGSMLLSYEVVDSITSISIPALQTFGIDAVNDAPSFSSGANQVVDEDSNSQMIPGWATDINAGPSDENSQTLNFLVSNDNTALFAAQPSIDSSGNLTYTPAANVNGAATITVSLQDSGGTANGGVDASASQTFTITVAAVNDAPQLTGAVAILPDGTEDSDYTVTASSLLSGWTDADSDTLSIQNLTTNHGTVIDNGGGNFTIQPQANYNGPVTLSYQVTDTAVTEPATLGFNLISVNDAPQLTGTAVTLADGIENTNYTVLTSDLLAGWSDIEGDALSIQNLAADHGTVSDNGNGSYTIKPDADYNGPLLLSYDVSDSISNTSTALQVNLNANTNQAPALNTALRNIGVRYDSSFSYNTSSSFNDPDGDSLSFSASLANGDPLPAWLEINATTGIISANPNFDNLGIYAINITATDAHAASVSGQMTVAVTTFSTGQLLVSTNGNDILQGAVSGIDTATYAYSPESVVVSLANLAAQDTGHGIDTLSNIENLIGSAVNDTLTGNDLSNVLDGGVGADRLIGGKGNDGYVIDSLGDVITEAPAQGSDNVLALITLPVLPSNVENLFLLGSANLNANGNTLNNFLTGNSGDNVLDGKSGQDSLNGGAGNDTYIIDNIGDAISENTDEGIDTVKSTVSYTLAANVENLNLLGTSNINANGNNLDNLLIGNNGKNTLMGAAGNDDLRGGNGNDVLFGGLGADQLTGGSDRDFFVFTTPTESGIAGNSDVILDFSKIESDRIDLSLIDAKIDTVKDDAFVWKGAAAFQGPGDLRYFYDTFNNVTVIEANIDFNLSADFQIMLAGNISLEAKDFVL